MQIPVKKWYDAIYQRRSRRQFNGRELSTDITSHLEEFSKEINEYITGVKAVLVNENPNQVFKGAIGSYGSIKGAPAYVAFVGNMEDANVQEKVGYIGEGFILEATSIGLATCWVGGFFRKEVAQKQVQINPNEQILAVSPVGYVDDKYSLEEKIMSKFAKSHNRKSLDELCVTEEKNWPSWVQLALDAARLAPSAINRQPWRFSVEDNNIKVSADSLKDSYHISKRLDCGIAMIHIEVGANHGGVKGRWSYLEKPDVALFEVI
ncbi:MAG: nitroreductase [Firmicutes bacterium]|nr:nitroreductase [Bacillota bacterium]